MNRGPRRGHGDPFGHLYWSEQGEIRPHAEKNERGLHFTEVTEAVAPLLEAVLQGEELSRDAWDALDGLAEEVAGNEECRVQAIGPLGSCRLALRSDDQEAPEAIRVVNGYRVQTNFGDQCWVPGLPR